MWEKKTITELVFSTEERTFKSSGEIAEKFLDVVFKNKETGMDATVSGRSLKKMLSGKAWKKSVSLQAHLAAVENVGVLFENANFSHREVGTKKGVLHSNKFFCDFSVGSENFTAKLTVHEYEEPNGNRIYSVETMKIKKAGGKSASKG